MIIYFVNAANRETMDLYLKSWGASLRPMIKIATYDRLPALPTLPAGTYIFSDLERMNPIQRALATEVWNQLSAAGPNVRLLNHPAQALGRL
jgi:hypothetical protein